MKKNIFLLFVIQVLLFTSCNTTKVENQTEIKKILSRNQMALYR
jgi:hypothetical protein